MNLKKILLSLLIVCLLLSFVGCNDVELDISPTPTGLESVQSNASPTPTGLESAQSNASPTPTELESEQGNASPTPTELKVFQESWKNQLQYFNSSKNVCTVIEYNDYVYFGKSDGVYRCKEGITELLFYINSPNYFCISDSNELYFFSDKKLYKITEKGYQLICSPAIDHYDDFYVYDYVIVNEKAYFCNAMEVVEYDFTTKKYNVIFLGGVATSVQVKENKLYFIPHASRTFSIYEYDLIKKTVNVVAGKDIEKPPADIIRDFVICENTIYYTQTHPTKMVAINSNYLLFDKEVLSLNKKDGTVYFVLIKNGTKGVYRIENEENVFIGFADISRFGNFTIVDNCIVYCSDDNEI